MKEYIKKLLREDLLDEVSDELYNTNEGEINLYFNMINKELDTYIKYLNNSYLSLGGINILDLINMDYDSFKTFERGFDTKKNKIFYLISDYNKKTNDFPEEDKYVDEMDVIYKKELIYRGKEDMFGQIFDAMGNINNVKDEFTEHPFDDIKPINIG